MLKTTAHRKDEADTTVGERTVRATAQLPTRIYRSYQEARIRKRLTIADVASLVGVTAKTLALYENGSEAPNDEVRRKLLSVLDITQQQ